jgi:hypothetical protein
MTISGSSSYHQVNSSSAHEGDLKGALFAGDHGPDGVWQSEKGSALTPPELSFTVQDVNYNDGRVDSQHEVVAAGGGWINHGPVESGTFDPQQVVRGTDKHMPR